MSSNVPQLRFPEFEEEWKLIQNSQIMSKVSIPVDVKDDEFYEQIGIRSHGKGIFYKEPVTGKALGNKRVFWLQKNMFIVNIVFAWEQAVAKTSEREEGLICSHRFPMYQPKEGVSDLDYILYFYLTPKGKFLLGLASPGGAGRNKTLGLKEFENIKYLIPSYDEQIRITNFLTSVDEKLAALKEKKELLEQYKKGAMQKLFSQELRFKQDDGSAFPDWEEKKLGDVGYFYYGKSAPKHSLSEDAPTPCVRYGELYTKYNGVIDKIYSYTEIPRKKLKFSQGNEILIPRVGEDPKDFCKCSWLKVKDVAIGEMISVYNTKQHQPFIVAYIRGNLKKEFARVVEGGNVSNLYFRYLEKITINLPSLPEQEKIADFLSSIDESIENVGKQIEASQEWKKGLIQKMFV